MRPRTRGFVIAVTVCGVLLAAGAAWASGAATRVTITSQQIASSALVFQGKIHSPRARCLGGRNIRVYRQRGSRQHPATDKLVASATSKRHGDYAVWHTHYIYSPGRKMYYARATRSRGCQAGTSKTITVVS